MKSRYNMLKKAVKDLQSICETHERVLETFQKHIVGVQWQKGELNLTCEGEKFEVMQ
jgi:hypothetical protein